MLFTFSKLYKWYQIAQRINFYYLSFHVRQHCQEEDSNTKLRKLAWFKRSLYPVKKNGERIWFCLQDFSCQKKAKIASSIWLWRREVLVHEVTTSLLSLKSRHNMLYCMPITDQYKFSDNLLSVSQPCLT